MIRLIRFRQKEVINIKDGKRLGFVMDAEIDEMSGRITSLVIPGNCSFFSLFAGRKNMIVPWENIRKIGKDIILVEISDERLPVVYN